MISLNKCHGNYKEVKKINYKLEIEISRKSTQKKLGDLRGSFQGFGCPKRHLDAPLAKTMHNTTYGDKLAQLVRCRTSNQ